MTLLVEVLSALIPLFALIALGFLLQRKTPLLHRAHVPILNGIVLNVTLPAVVFLAIARAPALTLADARLPLALIVAQAAVLAIAYVVGRMLRMARPALGMLMATSAFGNTTFLGYPIALSVLPRLFPSAVLLDQFGMVLVMFLVTPLIGSVLGAGAEAGGAPRDAIRRFGRNPIFLSVVAALIARSLPLPLPFTTNPAVASLGQIALRTLGYLAQATTPLVLLALGAALQPRAALGASRLLLLPCVLKLLLCPLLMWVACRALGLGGDTLRIGVLQASMPTSVLCSLLCAQYEMEGTLAGGVVFAATALSLVTIPLLQTILH